ncbi:sarcosine oxidase subunit gamma family protein [Roseovarius salis]|uniref:sarcosine oxidase subunit gamma n=1 Tax=Roseovarius salis TaxID=3376063 RepID=UPI0037C762F8
MAEYSLVSAPPLAGVDKSIGAVRIMTPKHLAIVAIALPLGGESAADTAVQSAYGLTLPPPGESAETGKGETLVRLGEDQAFVLFERAAPDAEAVVRDKLGEAVYVTDQTDSWCVLEMSGAGCRTALERICPIDLNPEAFGRGDAARTVMEHLGVLVLRTGTDSYLLLSASSSAGSFLHMLETSARNVA